MENELPQVYETPTDEYVESEITEEYEFDREDFMYTTFTQAATLAQEHGLHLRVIKREGNYLGGTDDHDNKRVNVTILHGVVIGARIG